MKRFFRYFLRLFPYNALASAISGFSNAMIGKSASIISRLISLFGNKSAGNSSLALFAIIETFESSFSYLMILLSLLLLLLLPCPSLSPIAIVIQNTIYWWKTNRIEQTIVQIIHLTVRNIQSIWTPFQFPFDHRIGVDQSKIYEKKKLSMKWWNDSKPRKEFYRLLTAWKNICWNLSSDTLIKRLFVSSSHDSFIRSSIFFNQNVVRCWKSDSISFHKFWRPFADIVIFCDSLLIDSNELQWIQMKTNTNLRLDSIKTWTIFTYTKKEFNVRQQKKTWNLVSALKSAYWLNSIQMEKWIGSTFPDILCACVYVTQSFSIPSTVHDTLSIAWKKQNETKNAF